MKSPQAAAGFSILRDSKYWTPSLPDPTTYLGLSFSRSSSSSPPSFRSLVAQETFVVELRSKRLGGGGGGGAEICQFRRSGKWRRGAPRKGQKILIHWGLEGVR